MIKVLGVILLISTNFAYANTDCEIKSNNEGRISYEVHRGSDKISESYFDITKAIQVRNEQIKLGACTWPPQIQECEIKSDTDTRVSFGIVRGNEKMSESYFDVKKTIAMRELLIANRICTFPGPVQKCEIKVDQEDGLPGYTVYRGEERLSESYLEETNANAFLATLRESAICNN